MINKILRSFKKPILLKINDIGNSVISHGKFYEEKLLSNFKRSMEENRKLVINLGDSTGFSHFFVDSTFGKLTKDFGYKKIFEYITFKTPQNRMRDLKVIFVINEYKYK